MNSRNEVWCDGTGGTNGSIVGNKCDEIDSGNDCIRYVPHIKIISEFIVSCKNGDIQMVKFWWDTNPLVLQGILTNMCYDDDLFDVICERGHLQVAKWIITNNPDFVSNIIHEDLMIGVCLAGKLSMAKWILTLSPHILVDEDEGDGYYLFRKVCKMGHLNVVKWLAKINPEIVENKQSLVSPFWTSCARGKLNIAKWIYSVSSEEVYSFKKNAEIDDAFISNDIEFKICMFNEVCRQGHIAVVKWLLTIIPPIEDEEMIQEIFNEACRSGHLNIAKCIFNAYPNTNISTHDDHTFRMVCSLGHLNIARWLLKIKQDIDISTEDDHAFRQACENGHLDVAKWLLHMKPDIDIRVEADNAFKTACEKGHLEVAKWLFDINPNIDISLDDVINTSLDDVINTKKANTHVVKWLFEVMPELYSFHNRGGLVDAFIDSCLTGNLELVKMIFEKQAEYISDRTTITNNAFDLACKSGNIELVNWLLNEFSNIDLSTNDELPFINACTNGHFMLAKRLLELKPDINISANQDKAFKNACRNGHQEVIRWLENMFPEKYSVGGPIYLGNGLEYDSDDEEDEEDDENYLNIDGELSTNYTYEYTISKNINITQNILRQDISKEIDDCSICLDSTSNIYTSCSHMYCKPCITKWLKTHDTCPCCRVELEDENMANIIS
jgi:ankyrin repeat protein